MKKVLVSVSIILGALTGCVGYAGDGYGRYSDRYDSYGPGPTYYGSGYRNVDYRRGDRNDWRDRRAAEIRERNKRREERRDRNDWRDRRDHDRGSSWNHRREDSFSRHPSPRETRRNFDSANRKLNDLKTKQQR